MKEERIWILIARKVSNEATKEELNELESLLQTNPDLQFTAESFYNLWNRPASEEQGKEINEEKILKRIRQEDSSQRPHSRYKKESYQFFKKNFMIRNYFKVAWRNLVRDKAFSLINITGLAIGMASAILVLVWIAHQFSFDQFHEKKDRIYQLYNLGSFDGKKEAWNGTSSLLGPVLQSNYPQVEEMFRVNWVANLIFTTGEKHLEAQGAFTDPGFLKALNFPLISGNKNTALNNPESVVLTETFAKKLFDDKDPLGQPMRVDSNANFTVTGIIKDPPLNTAFEFDYLIPMTYRKQINWEIAKWEDFGVGTYVLLKPGVSEAEANKLFRNVVKTHAPATKNEIFVHPMSKWHLYSRFENGKTAGGMIQVVRMFAIIGGFILLIACINYMNLSTAKSEKRAREVGIRKVIGARKTSLIGQFIGESILIAFIAGVFALLLAELNIGWFNDLLYSNLSIPYSSPYFWIFGIVFILLTGIIAGSYPALFLSAYRPIRVLKGVGKATNALVTPRKVLVVFQFSFAIVFIVSTIVIYRQIKLGEGKDTGFNMEKLVYVYLRGNINNKYAALKNELYSSGAIESVTRTNSPITMTWTFDQTFEWEGKDPNSKMAFATYHSDNDFVKTMGVNLIAGRDINTLIHPTDSMSVLLNEAAVKSMGLKDPVGQYIKSSQGNWQIVGVVKDFIVGSPYFPVFPIIIQGPKNWFGTLTFRLSKNNRVQDNLARISTILKKYNPDYPSNFIFVDDDHAGNLKGDQHTGKLAALFAGLAIFISCLGLYALASYMATNRIKEIGVRKVLGASVASITTMLSKDFLKLVFISFIIASPVAWWMMSSWLRSYTYRVSLSWWVFVIAALLSILIALITVSFQAIKAAIANPVKSLRTE